MADAESLPGLRAPAQPGVDLDAELAMASLERRMFGRLSRPITLGRYVLLERVGAGGAGEVYAAYDPELDRKVAVKLLRAGAGDERQRERLIREARAIAQLAHPNIIAVFDVGTYDERELERGGAEPGADADPGSEARGVFVVMELVAGQTLADWLTQRPRSWREVVGMYIQAGDGLVAAHRSGLVHRDFKPSNVLVGHDGRARVLDFGLARFESQLAASGVRPLPPSLLAAQDADEAMRAITAKGGSAASQSSPFGATLTQAGALLGTPAYMSPEQHAGSPADARSDQYSFAVALYQGLYGRLPFDGTSARALALAKDAGSLALPPGSTVPLALFRTIARALAREPASRYPSLSDLLAELARDPLRTRRRVLAAAAVLALGGLALGVSATVEHRTRQRCEQDGALPAGIWDDERRATVRAAVEVSDRPYVRGSAEWLLGHIDDYAAGLVAARTEACMATRVDGTRTEEALARTSRCLDSRVEGLRVAADLLVTGDAAVIRNSARMVGGLGPIADCADPNPPAPSVASDPELHAAVERGLAGGYVLVSAGRLPEARTIADELQARAREAEDDVALARVLLLAGTVEIEAGAHMKAEPLLLAGLGAAERIGDEPSAVRSMAELVALYGHEVGDLGKADVLATIALARLERRDLGARIEAFVVQTVGMLRVNQGRADEGFALLRRAVELREQSFGTEDPTTALAYDTLGSAHLSAGQFDRAAENYAKALDVTRAALGADHPQCAIILNNLGAVAANRGQDAEAIARFEEARALNERAYGPDHPLVAMALANLAGMESSRGDNAKGLEYALRAIAVQERSGPESANLARYLANAGRMLREARRFAEAHELLARALAMRERLLGADHPDVAETLAALAGVETHAGRDGEAIALYTRALAIWKASTRFTRTIPGSYVARGRLYAKQTKTRLAVADFEAALASLRAHPGNPIDGAEVEFELARAVWKTDEARARELAASAREAYAAASATAEVEAIDRWLGERAK
ncbi:serine/threonine-protein kinase [Nannocystis radixulma]|uniref:Serine/threonine-protein kinase n=1 Tax=Nannocystis radixulma TaxID=2995305 RepID=A0ABT5AWH8_9BACT|nr:serine/threonine-protein kinase [Nannocystis radixulma]MDC0666195.1 serine/threonine-protein kinase [Nannocystis radixulma]